ncbi:hypothetical protein CRE_27930 [Caenorhabditis remanei]|uniref:C-type lectin domain-containing protein n=1 Tax=Caenorhabditis remanei TaxID=31234 RepID=E3NMB2_CAERE|nr:hypothetical protein CRE_27930 [Caenorhabditis remanei]
MLRQFIACLALLILPQLTLATAGTPICTNGFTLINGKCWRFFATGASHRSAERTCMNYGATLVTVKNAIDNRAVQTIVGTSTYSIWMGLYCFGNDVTKCLWDDASGSSELYDNFLSAYPQIETGKCVVYSLQSSMVGRWYSADCQNETRAFVCELPTSYAGWLDNFVLAESRFSPSLLFGTYRKYCIITAPVIERHLYYNGTPSILRIHEYEYLRVFFLFLIRSSVIDNVLISEKNVQKRFFVQI